MMAYYVRMLYNSALSIRVQLNSEFAVVNVRDMQDLLTSMMFKYYFVQILNLHKSKVAIFTSNYYYHLMCISDY